MLTTALLLGRLSIHGHRSGPGLAASSTKGREVGLDPPRLFRRLEFRGHIRSPQSVESDFQYPEPLPLVDD